MALDFPNAPTVNQTYAGPSGVLWSWDGLKWVNATVAGGYAPVQSPVFTGDPQAPTQPATDADTSVATTAFVQTAVGGANHNIGRNLIHNPLFNVAQRGAGPWASNAYTADRWSINSASDTISFSVVTLADVDRGQIGDEAAAYCLGNTFTGSAAAGASTYIWQGIESVRRLAGKTVTVSFWGLAPSGTLKLGVSIRQYFGSGGSPSASVDVAAQSVTMGVAWARYSLTFSLPSIAGKTLGTNGDAFTILRLWYSSGATNNVIAGSIGVQSGTIDIWGVQLEIGSVATPLEKPDPRYDLANCQRFYYAYTGVLTWAFNSWAASGSMSLPYAFPTTMRATPTVALGTSSSNTNVSAVNILVQSPMGFVGQAMSVAAGGAGINVAGYTASADL